MRPPFAAAGALLLAAVPALGAPADGDLLVMKDGKVVDGVRMARDGDSFTLSYNNGQVRVPASLVEDFVIAGSTVPEPATEEEKAKRAQGLVPFRGRWVRLADREKQVRKEIDQKKKAIEEYRKHREWRDRYQFKTKNFEFESTQPPWQNEEFSELLETYFAEFAKVWKVRVPQDWGRLKVCFYGNSGDFHRIAGAPGNVLAYYRFAPPRELDFYYDRTDPVYSVAILFHEANHYLTDLMDERFQYPHWVNEAMAEYYGASIWDPAKRSMTTGGIQHGRLAHVRADIEDRKRLTLPEIVGTDAQAYEHYTWGWTLVHFLMETPKYRPKFIRFFVDLATAKDIDRRPWGAQFTVVKDGKEILRAFLSRMGLKESDLDALQKEWYEHIEAMGPTGILGLEQGGIRAFKDGNRLFKAPRLLKAAIDKGSTKTQVLAAYAWCLFGKGDDASRTEAFQTVEKACAMDPLNGEAWAMRGCLAYATGNKEEGERFLALAREVDPEADFLDAEVWVKLQEALKEGGG